MSTAALEVCLPAAESVSHAGCAAGSQANSDLYYKLVDPLAPMSLTGALWYQGESNVAQNWKPTNASWPFDDYYACLFKSKVQSWRKAFRSPDMFYGFVSLAAYGGDDPDGGAARSASGLPRMRLDQNSVLSLPNTGVSLALDLGDNGKIPFTPRSGRHGGIHPRCALSSQVISASFQASFFVSSFHFVRQHSFILSRAETRRKSPAAWLSPTPRSASDTPVWSLPALFSPLPRLRGGHRGL